MKSDFLENYRIKRRNFGKRNGTIDERIPKESFSEKLAAIANKAPSYLRKEMNFKPLNIE